MYKYIVANAWGFEKSCLSTLVISLLLLPLYCRCQPWLLSDELIDTNGTDRRILPMLLDVKKLLDESVY